MSCVKVLGDGGDQTGVHLHVRLPLEKGRKRLVEQTLQSVYLLFHRT
jgi:hypothetical protein